MNIESMADDDIAETYFDAIDELECASEEEPGSEWFRSCFDFVGYLQYEIINRRIQLVTLH